jgi:hypothetical protein
MLRFLALSFTSQTIGGGGALLGKQGWRHGRCRTGSAACCLPDWARESGVRRRSGFASSSGREQSTRFAVLHPPDARELNSWRTGKASRVCVRSSDPPSVPTVLEDRTQRLTPAKPAADPGKPGQGLTPAKPAGPTRPSAPHPKGVPFHSPGSRSAPWAGESVKTMHPERVQHPSTCVTTVPMSRSRRLYRVEQDPTELEVASSFARTGQARTRKAASTR